MSCNKSQTSSLAQISLNAARSQDPLVNTSFLIAAADRRAVNLWSRQLCRNLQSGNRIKETSFQRCSKSFWLMASLLFQANQCAHIFFFILCSSNPFTFNHFLACEKCKYNSCGPFCSLALTPPSAADNSSLPDMEPCTHGNLGPPSTGHGQAPC